MEETQLLREIVIDKNPDNCKHDSQSNTVTNIFNILRDGTRWHSPTRFHYGTFSALIKCPSGNTGGLCFAFYLSSREGDKHQDEIDIEILGKNRTVVETDYHVKGNGKHEKKRNLGFDSSERFHKYAIKWTKDKIVWSIDGEPKRTILASDVNDFPTKPMYLYASIWNASIHFKEWAGPYLGGEETFECVYKDIQVPVVGAVEG